MQDHYKILGVSPRDDGDRIRAAYRRLVREIHPDMSERPADNTRFAQVTEAYRVLSDADQRRKYDALRLVTMMLPVRKLLEVAEDPLLRSRVASTIAGGLHRLSQAARGDKKTDGDDIVLKRAVSFADSYTGTTLEVTYARPVRCENCEGFGVDQPQVCRRCEGRGYLPLGVVPGLSKTCTLCGGDGVTGDGPCPDCDGCGLVVIEENVRLRVPAGARHGLKLQLRSRGAHGRYGGKDGNLIVALQVEGSLKYGRSGNNLTIEAEVPLSVAVNGGQLDVALPDESILRVAAPARTYPGKQLRVSGFGFADAKSKNRGDLLLTIDVSLPPHLNDEERDLAAEWFYRARDGHIPADLAAKISDLIGEVS